MRYPAMVSFSCLLLLPFGCGSTGPDDMTENPAAALGAQLVHQEFVMDDPQIDKPLKPFAAFREGDTLEVHDYWAVSQEGGFVASSTADGDTVTITYESASYVMNDWHPPVEAVLKIALSSYGSHVVVEAGPAPHARPPDSTEAAQGFRYANTMHREIVSTSY